MKRNNKDLVICIILVIVISLIRISHDLSKMEKEQHAREVKESNKQLQLWNEYRAAKD